MKRGGTVAAIGATALAVLYCAGLPLIVGTGAIFGSLGVALLITLIAITTMTIVTRRRRA